MTKELSSALDRIMQPDFAASVRAAAVATGPVLKHSVKELAALAWLRFEAERRDREIDRLPLREEAHDNPARVVLEMLKKK